MEWINDKNVVLIQVDSNGHARNRMMMSPEQVLCFFRIVDARRHTDCTFATPREMFLIERVH